MLKEMKDYDYYDQDVVVRCDLNVPLDSEGRILDDSRIKACIPTLKHLLDSKAHKIAIISHFGRPNGKFDQKYSLKFLVPILEKHLDEEIFFIEDLTQLSSLRCFLLTKYSRTFLLENVRFHEAEELNTPRFSRQLANYGDYYINDAFSCSHRNHASITGITNCLKRVAGGFNLIKEVNFLKSVVENPQKPLVGIIGGSKVSTKLKLINNLIEKLDYLIIGGAMANTFLKAQGYELGKSLVEEDMIDNAKEIIEKFSEKLILPVDAVVASSIDAKDTINTDFKNFPKDMLVGDIGKKSVEKFIEVIDKAKMVFWNGPLGAFEYKPFSDSSLAIAKFLAQKTKQGDIQSIAGGGETVAVIDGACVSKDFTFVSTAGGAFLEFLEGSELVGLKVLEQ
jgi:phosphoglycerate kinase